MVGPILQNLAPATARTRAKNRGCTQAGRGVPDVELASETPWYTSSAETPPWAALAILPPPVRTSAPVDICGISTADSSSSAPRTALAAPSCERDASRCLHATSGWHVCLRPIPAADCAPPPRYPALSACQQYSGIRPVLQGAGPCACRASSPALPLHCMHLPWTVVSRRT